MIFVRSREGSWTNMNCPVRCFTRHNFCLSIKGWQDVQGILGRNWFAAKSKDPAVLKASLKRNWHNSRVSNQIKCINWISNKLFWTRLVKPDFCSSLPCHLLISYVCMCRSQWPRDLRRRSAAARLSKSWVRIPPGAWMSVCCECWLLSGRGLCDGLITRPEKSYRL